MLRRTTFGSAAFVRVGTHLAMPRHCCAQAKCLGCWKSFMDRSLCVEAYHCEPSSATIHSWGCGMVCAASLASRADVIRDTESWLATPGWTRQIGWSPCLLAPRCPFFAKSASSQAGLPAPLRRGRTWACGDSSKPLAAEVFFGRRAPGHSTGMLLRPREVSQQGSLGFESVRGTWRGWHARVVAGLALSPVMRTTTAGLTRFCCRGRHARRQNIALLHVDPTAVR